MTLKEFEKLINFYSFKKYFLSMDFFTKEVEILGRSNKVLSVICRNSFLQLEINCYENSVSISISKSDLDYFTLRGFLIAKKIFTVFQMDEFEFSRNYKSREEMLKAYLDLLEQTTKDHLVEVLTGKVWIKIPPDFSVAGR
ncbi:MAG: hypothetical protein A2Z20_12625 [Bdellovibrionales bacterium RBG_16_40_8]|nr:MAG: hypothetical protein A2Z20_12625 [Bdellovibrionales bacterium RBG_16_40_8]